MKKTGFILLLITILLLTVFIFRDPIIDFLPVDQSRWVEQEGNRYLLNEDGDPRTGWYSTEGAVYYFREDGAMHTGWLELDGVSHYFGTDGLLASGLLEQEGKRFYLDENGSPVVGWQQVGEQLCYITADGTIPSGWLELEGRKYFLADQGSRYSGWLDDSNGRYYFDSEGILHTGWLELGDSTYYMNPQGIMARGWTEIDGSTYYFDETGCRGTGWLELEEGRYYLGTDGQPHTGWLELDGSRYYTGTDGKLHTGWLELDGNRYYLQEDGTAAVGKLEIDGQNFFFSSSGVNFIMVNPWHSLPEDFSVDLVDIPGARLDPICREALEKMLADCRAAGFYPQIVSSHRTIADQRAILSRMVESLGGNYEAAIQIVAIPGTSEHHLGLAFDIVDIAYSVLDHQQAKMPAQQWLMEHCWEYGFILRYPENTTHITGIIWEPWHYRYVGTEMSLEIRDLGCITLEEYIDRLTNDGTTCGGQKTE